MKANMYIFYKKRLDIIFVIEGSLMVKGRNERETDESLAGSSSKKGYKECVD